MKNLPRGIAPDLLLSQVKNTMPYLFTPETGEKPLGHLAPAMVLRDFEKHQNEPLSHFEYYRLCLSSHYLSCGTPVPTDVDNQIRLKLWPKQLPLETALQMADLIIQSRKWDFRLVSTRYTYGAPATEWEKEVLSGHLGEWFTVSCGAYCALHQYQAPEAAQKREALYQEIADEVNRHSEIFGTLWRAGDGLNCLISAANMAHNFGDLDRVMDMWELPLMDPLRVNFYKLTAKPFDSSGKLRYMGRLWVAGELYKSPIQGSALAFENHRHFALRKPKCLRRAPELVVPNGPFFDGWGTRVAQAFRQEDGKPSEDTLEVVDALTQGWERLSKTVGYGRALRGIAEVHPELKFEDLNKTQLRLLQIPRDRFEKAWSDEALRLMDDIPSRA